MYRISVTSLEKFRRYMNNVSDWDTEEALIETLKGLFTGNDKTKTGSAYHKIIEGDFSLVKESGIVYADGFAFSMEQALPALNFRAEHMGMVHEIPVSKIYEVGDINIQVSGRLDGVEGIEIRDTKTKYKTINFQEYMESCQWKFYLDMLQLDTFHYDVFEVKGFDSLPGTTPIFLPGVQFMPCESITCYSYSSMEADCHRLLNDFMQYIDNRNFYHLLKKANETSIF